MYGASSLARALVLKQEIYLKDYASLPVWFTLSLHMKRHQVAHLQRNEYLVLVHVMFLCLDGQLILISFWLCSIILFTAY